MSKYQVDNVSFKLVIIKDVCIYRHKYIQESSSSQLNENKEKSYPIIAKFGKLHT